MNDGMGTEDRLGFVTNVSSVDVWSFVHIGAGIILGVLFVPRPLAYGLIFGVELFELVARRFMDVFRETRSNILADLVIGISAYELTRALRQ